MKWSGKSCIWNQSNEVITDVIQLLNSPSRDIYLWPFPQFLFTALHWMVSHYQQPQVIKLLCFWHFLFMLKKQKSVFNFLYWYSLFILKTYISISKWYGIPDHSITRVIKLFDSSVLSGECKIHWKCSITKTLETCYFVHLIPQVACFPSKSFVRPDEWLS